MPVCLSNGVLLLSTTPHHHQTNNCTVHLKHHKAVSSSVCGWIINNAPSEKVFHEISLPPTNHLQVGSNSFLIGWQPNISHKYKFFWGVKDLESTTYM